jgi:hypothetical protein
MINEITAGDDEIGIIKWRPVVVEDWGSEGTMRVHADECPMDNGVSCVSGSGSSICIGFHGHASNRVIRCTEEMKDA